MHILQLIRVPGQQQLPWQPVVAVLHHPGHGDVDVAAVLYIGQQLLIQIALVPAEIVIGVYADHRVKKLLLEGESHGVSLHRLELLRPQALGGKEGVVLLRVAPQV